MRSWNAHTIPGQSGAVPNHLAQSFCQLGQINPAVLHYESSGGRLTHLNSEVTFGADPLCGYPEISSSSKSL